MNWFRQFVVGIRTETNIYEIWNENDSDRNFDGN